MMFGTVLIQFPPVFSAIFYRNTRVGVSGLLSALSFFNVTGLHECKVQEINPDKNDHHTDDPVKCIPTHSCSIFDLFSERSSQ